MNTKYNMSSKNLKLSKAGSESAVSTKFNMSSKNLKLSRAGSESSANSSSLGESSVCSDKADDISPNKILLKSESLSSVVEVPDVDQGMHDDSSSSEGSASGSSDDSSSSSYSGERSPSPEVPAGQYEVEVVLDYAKDDNGEVWLVKWKNWEEEFNTWEPITNLENCSDLLLEFYRKRKQEYDAIMSESEYVITESGKKRRKGPRIHIQVPPDPRTFELKLQAFFEMFGNLTDIELMECQKKIVAMKKKTDSSRAVTKKLELALQDAIDGKSTQDLISSCRKQLIEYEYCRRRQEHNVVLKDWEAHINKISAGNPKIIIQNDVDWAAAPPGFQFVNDYVAMDDISIPNDPPVGCSCAEGCYDNRNGCCAAGFGGKFAYSMSGRLRVPVGTPIYECNRKCKCDSRCPNRVVQDGLNPNMEFCIFRTSNGCGWGVKTLKSIKKGTFVTLYVGEVINTEEAERRGREYDAEGVTYLFDLDFNEQEHCPYTVDAAKYGNIAHFINHSCDPNLAVFAVWVDCLDVNLPKLALFAIYDIPKGAELTFDYKNLVEDRGKEDDGKPRFNKECLCGTSNCRKYLF